MGQYKVRLENLLSQQPRFAKQKRELFHELRSMQTALIIHNLAIAKGAVSDPDVEADIERIGKKLVEIGELTARMKAAKTKQ